MSTQRALHDFWDHNADKDDQMKTAEEGSLFHRSYRTCKELGAWSHYWREV